MKNKIIYFIFGLFLIIGSMQVFATDFTLGFVSGNEFENNGNNINGINNLTLVGTANYISGDKKIGNYAFNCSSGYGTIIDTNNVFDFNNTNFTFAFWVKTQEALSGAKGLFARSSATYTSYEFGLGLTTAVAGNSYMSSTFSSWDIMGTNTFSILPNYDTWIQRTITRNGNNITFYENGVYKYSVNMGAEFVDVTANLTLCGAQGSYSKQLFDSFYTWKKGFNQTQVTELYNYMNNNTAYPFTSVSNFSITNINNYNNASILNFSAIINGTTYNTTTGTITTPILSNSTLLWNITIISQNMFNKTYLNVNVSSSLSASQDQYPILFVKNVWNQSNISSFNVTNEGFYSTSNGLAYIFTNSSTNILVQSTNYFSLNTTMLLLQNTIQYVNLSQSIINITVKELFTNSSISNFSINISGYGLVCNTSTSVCPLIYPNNGTYTGIVIDNKGQDDYHTTSANFSVSFLDNKTVTLFVHQHYINIFARDIQTNATINTYTINLTDLNLSSDQRQNATISGIITFPVIHHAYNLTIVSAPGYAFTSWDGTFNQTQTVSISSDVNVTFYLYKYNSVNFTFYDVDFPNTLLISNITMGLFYDANDSINYTTNVGWIFAENLTTGDWEARYSAPLFNSNNYFFTVTDSSTQRITLYLQNNSATTLFKIILRDQNDDVVSNNLLRLQQQFALFDGQYITIRECKTNAEGVCYMYIQEGIDTSYRFIVIDIDGNMIKTTDPAPIVTLASEEKVITIRVDTGSNLVEPLQKALGVDAEITFSGNVSTYDFIDGYNAIIGGCFKISRRAFVNSTYTILNYTCVSGTSGSISYNFSSSLQNDSFLLFQGYVNYTNNQILVAEQSKSNRVAGTSYDEDDNLFFILVLFCFLSFAMVFVPNIFIQILVDFGALIGVVWIGYSAIGIPIIMSFLALGLFIAWDRKTARGFN